MKRACVRAICTGAQHLCCALVHQHDADFARQVGSSAHSRPQPSLPAQGRHLSWDEK